MKKRAIERLLEAIENHRRFAKDGDSFSALAIPRLVELLRQVRRASGSHLIDIVETYEILENR